MARPSSCPSENFSVAPDPCRLMKEMVIDDLTEEEGAAFLAALEA